MILIRTAILAASSNSNLASTRGRNEELATHHDGLLSDALLPKSGMRQRQTVADAWLCSKLKCRPLRLVKITKD
ncbi:hypothetical protein QA635_33375 [Bradyrhizobium brasilense]|uniref:hypothetical protein n=1 Tax=Bradyrhizobium brasilense TaxID=1419277 RepID=UPI0024B24EF1|nr:hypothetical protein [Bradyrhizobium australafricanum]WFU31391.1 hypothetical protein QA635_33375 [Bradyrhizobium australafricanum]